MATREEKIAQLAATLKASGFAKSDSQAKSMAEEMVSVEDSVQKRFDQEHTRADEYLKTAKNLGTQRQTVTPVQTKSSAPVIQPILNQPSQSPSRSELRPAETRLESKPFMEEIRMRSRESSPVVNSELERIKNDVSKSFEQTESKTEHKIEDIPQVNASEFHEPDSKIDENEKQNVQLDSKKLVELMEEDGKLEEHTREIKEKPKDVKPKEAYAENNIDLSNMFNFGKK